MQMTGIKISKQQLPTYQRKLRSIMTYKPNAKIPEFIKESVLERDDVKFEKLKEAKTSIEQITQALDGIKSELQDVDAILKDWRDYEIKSLQFEKDDIKILYRGLLKSRRLLAQKQNELDDLRVEHEQLGKEMDNLKRDIGDVEACYHESRQALREMDVSKAITASEELVKNYSEQLFKIDSQRRELEEFQKKIQPIVEMLDGLDKTEDKTIGVAWLTSRDEDVVKKQRILDELRERIHAGRDMLMEHRTIMKTELQEVRNECAMQRAIIDNCNRNMVDYSYVKEQRELIKEINREFKIRDIDAKAHMAFEYVIELSDENWRKAIETFLGPHRYAVIVPAGYFGIANEVMDRSEYRYVELVNTKRLMSREMDCEKDSVYQFLTIHNAEAVRYFQFWLGKIHAVEKVDVPNYDNAMSREGKLSRNFAVTYMNMSKVRNYCLGNKAIELNKILAEKELERLEERENELTMGIRAMESNAEDLKESLAFFKEFNLSAHSEWSDVSAKLSEEERRYEKLLEAQRSNAEFMTLNSRVSALKDELDAKRKVQNEVIKKRMEAEVNINSLVGKIAELREDEKNANQELEERKLGARTIVEDAIAEYDTFSKGDDVSLGVLEASKKKDLNKLIQNLGLKIVGAQQAYNSRKTEEDRLPQGLEYEVYYIRRKQKIQMDDIQIIQQKLNEQTSKYEVIFKREFVLKIYSKAKDAEKELRDINKELKRLKFATRYQFDVKFVSDKSDYAKILRYAEYLDKTNRNASIGQMTFAQVSGYDTQEVETMEIEIKHIINKIIDNNTAEVEKFADYRNYMKYDIRFNTDDVKDGYLSQQISYNSGAGTQIPYTIMLTAALSMLYNTRVNSARLIFIDEPFEKMSNHNIRLMLEFFKQQNLQVIFCAPDNKIESIGSECGVIIPVKKMSNDNMQLGKVIMHEK